MRYTRTKQVEKVNKYMKGSANVPISYMCQNMGLLDKTFRWKRDFGSAFTNLVFFRGKNGQLKVVLAKESI